MKRKALRLLAKVSLVCLSLLIALALAEVGVRVLKLAPAAQGQESIQSVLQFDDKLETRYQPNSHAAIQSQYGEFKIDYDFNELGLRDRPLKPPATDKDYRILALGNSFVEGWGVQAEDSFLRIAEQRLNSTRSGDRRSVRIVNAGASGYGAAQCYVLCKDLLPQLRPDAVVFFYIPTMLSADHKYLRKADVDAQGLAKGLNMDVLLSGPTQTTSPSKHQCFLDSTLSIKLAEYSGLLRLIRSRLANRAAQKGIVPGDPQTDLLAAYRTPAHGIEELHAPALRHIVGMARLARQAGLPFLVVQLPMPFEVSAHEWEQGRKIYGLDDKVMEHPDPTNHLAAVLKAEKIDVLSAQKFLAGKAAQKANDPHIYFSFDFHLNIEGHKMLGSWLADTLSQRVP